jgi:hypothetical protein
MLRGLNGCSRSLPLHQPAGVLGHHPLVLGQTSPPVVLLLPSVYPLIRAGIDLTLYLLVGWRIGRLALSQVNWLAATAVARLAIMAFVSLELVRQRLGAELCPFTHVLRGMRAALLEAVSLGGLLPSIPFPSAFSLLAMPIGLGIVLLGLRRARIDETAAERSTGPNALPTLRTEHTPELHDGSALRPLLQLRCPAGRGSHSEQGCLWAEHRHRVCNLKRPHAASNSLSRRRDAVGKPPGGDCGEDESGEDGHRRRERNHMALPMALTHRFFQGRQREPLSAGKWTDRCADQPAQVGPAAKLGADVVRQYPNIRAT